jgi:hypothetical protein
MTIKQVLEHPWLQKYDSKKVTEKRRMSKVGESDFVIYSTTDSDKNG